MKNIIVILIVLSCYSCVDKHVPHPYTFHSINNFDYTAVEDLAKYVDDNDTMAIVKFLKSYPDISVDTRDRFFGSSLLMFAIYNHKYEAFHCLLNHGADPNFISDYEKRTPLYYAVTYYSLYESGVRYCKELLERGADPNYGYIIHESIGPGRDLGIVKLLVEYGADYNTKHNRLSPADLAILFVQPEIAEYLIIEKKAVLYDFPFWKNWDSSPEAKYSVAKKRIIEYLKKNPQQAIYLQKNDKDTTKVHNLN